MKRVSLFSFATATAAAGGIAALPSGAVQIRDHVTPPDSIYSLAVKPSDHPNDAVVVLLDEGVYRIEADGRTSTTTRQVVQILTEQGAQQYREQRLSYNPSHQTLKVNWMRVVRPNGEIVSAEPAQVQESDIPAAMDDPVYVATKVRRMSLSGLDPGTILDHSTTLEELKPIMEGDFLINWRVTTPRPVVQSNLVVNVPAAYTPRIDERNLAFKRKESVSGGRKIIAWTTSNVPRVEIERFAPDSLSPLTTITVSPAFDWRHVGKWYAPITRDAYAITPLVEEKIAAVTARARTRDDSIRALHRWVAQDIRYVAVELGRGGYVPRSAETVVRTGFGDCKDKTMLFLASLRKIGVPGYPVLLNLFGISRTSSPSLKQFNHMIAAVGRGDTYEFADLTAPTYPLGRLPRSEAGALAVLVRENDAEEIRLPPLPFPEGGTETTIVGRLSENGIFSGTIEQVYMGTMESLFRQLFQNPLDSARRATLARTMARNQFESADADSLEVFDGKDFTVPAKARVRVSNAKVVSQAANVRLLTNPLRPSAVYARIADDLQKEPPRKTAIDLSRIVGPTKSHFEARMKLPAGWRATLPKNDSVSGAPGTFVSTYAQVGDELRISRTLVGSRNVVPASRMPEVIAWLKAAGRDDSKLILLQTPSSRALRAIPPP